MNAHTENLRELLDDARLYLDLINPKEEKTKTCLEEGVKKLWKVGKTLLKYFFVPGYEGDLTGMASLVAHHTEQILITRLHSLTEHTL